MRILFYVIGLFLCAVVQVNAHNPNEISYFFKMDQKELVIHLTPKSAIDLLESLHPHLKKEHQFSLRSFDKDFQRYFKERVLFKVNDSAIPLQLVETRLNDHDATLRFIMEDVPQRPEHFQISVLSFTEVYKRTKNHVFLYSRTTKQHYALDVGHKTIAGDFKQNENQHLNTKIILLSISLIFMLLSIGFAVYRKRGIPFKPFPAS